MVQRKSLPYCPKAARNRPGNTGEEPCRRYSDERQASAVLLLQRFAEDVAEAGARIGRTILRDGFLLFGDLHRLDREVRLLRTIEADDHGIELLTDLEALGALLVAVAAEVGPLDETGGPILADLHFEPAVADFEHRDGDDVVPGDAARAGAGRTAAALELLDAEADALLLDVDVEHL